MRRKLLSAAVSASAGIAVTYCFGILTGLLTCGAFLFVFGCQFRENRLYVWLAAAFFCGCLLLSFSGNKAASGLLAACPPEQDTVLTGRVTEIQCLEEDKYKICCEIGGEKLLCSYYQKLDRWWNLIGADIRFSTRIETPEPAGNPRTFDYSLYLKSRGIHYTAVIGNFDIESQNCSLLMRMQRKILERREQFLQELQISEQAAALLRGALFGDTAQLNEDTYEEFRQNGTAHVLAVSGLHVGMLYGVYRILSKKRKGILLPLMFMALLLVYGTAALWAVSVTRAVILIFLLLAADLLERRYDLLTGLAAIAVLSMARNPYVIFGAGFQMSFLAVLSMAFLIPALKKKMNETLAAMISVQLGLMPYMAYTFNYVSLVGFICNVPVIFLISILVPAGIGGYLFCLFTGAVPPVLPELLNGMSVLVLNVNHFFTSDGILSFDVVSPPLWLICIIYFLMFFCSSEYFLIYFGRRQWKKFALPVALMAVLTLEGAVYGASDFDRADMVFVDVGQGDCLQLKDWGGTDILIDGGGSVKYNIGKKVLKPYLLKNGTGRVELALATHLHTDHYLGLEELAECFPVNRVITEGRAGQKIRVDKDRWIDILWPTEENSGAEDENLSSMVFRICDRGLNVLVTGDITAEGEKLLLSKYRGTGMLQADVLKVAHHGSAYSSCDEFLAEVKPKAAVISVGKNNYGHPDKMIIEKMQKNGIIVLRTDHFGAVGIIHKRGKMEICTEKHP